MDKNANIIKTASDFEADFVIFEPEELPSAGVFYEKTVKVERFKPLHISKMVEVATGRGDMKLLVDTFQSVVDMDVRGLTPADFEFLMFWQVFCLGHGTYTVPWLSKYANRNVHDMTWDELVIQRPLITRDAYLEFVEAGFEMTTTGLWEEAARSDATEDLAWLYDRAQFFAGSTWRERVSKLNDSGMGGLRRAEDLQRRSLHGVVKVLNLRDAGFDAHAHIRDLVAERNTLRLNLQYLRNKETIYQVMRDVSGLDKQIDELRSRITQGSRVEADVERISFGVMASDFTTRY